MYCRITRKKHNKAATASATISQTKTVFSSDGNLSWDSVRRETSFISPLPYPPFRIGGVLTFLPLREHRLLPAGSAAAVCSSSHTAVAMSWHILIFPISTTRTNR